MANKAIQAVSRVIGDRTLSSGWALSRWYNSAYCTANYAMITMHYAFTEPCYTQIMGNALNPRVVEYLPRILNSSSYVSACFNSTCKDVVYRFVIVLARLNCASTKAWAPKQFGPPKLRYRYMLCQSSCKFLQHPTLFHAILKFSFFIVYRPWLLVYERWRDAYPKTGHISELVFKAHSPSSQSHNEKSFDLFNTLYQNCGVARDGAWLFWFFLA